MISTRQANIIKTASIESVLSTLDSMAPEEIDNLISSKVKEMGIGGVVSLAKNTLINLAKPQRSAAYGDSGWTNNKSVGGTRPTNFKNKINAAGGWSYLLAFLMLMGTAGASDLGASWTDVFKGLLATVGTAFFGWTLKHLASKLKD